MKYRSSLAAAVLAFLPTACSSPSIEEREEQALTDVKAYVTSNLTDFVTASRAIQQAAPAPDADGWNATADAEAVAKMKAEWKKARVAYERVEGAIAVLFPELDASTDERYDGFVATEPDTNLFDDQVVTGVHAIERILWSDAIPAQVKAFEQTLPNYRDAAFPTTATEAQDFKEKLVARLVRDAESMKEQFEPLALDPEAAYRGVVGSMEEQLEKATLVAGGEEESRYAQFTLADMRANVEGGTEIFKAFSEWLKDAGGEAEAKRIEEGLSKLRKHYDSIPGDALPAVPEGWSSADPKPADLETDFGKLYKLLLEETDPAREGSTVHTMNVAADKLGIPQLPEE